MNTPVLYCSNQTVVDKNLKEIRERFHVEPRHDLVSLISKNQLSGCTMVMNKELKELIVQEDNLPSDGTIKLRLHDTWCMIVATIEGQIIYDNESQILYRQHEDNVVGAKQMSKKAQFVDKIQRVKAKKYKGARSQIAREIAEKFANDLKTEDINSVLTIANCNSLYGGVSLCKNRNVRKAFNEGNLVLLIKCILGWI